MSSLSASEKSKWFYSDTDCCAGVVLLVHGLNQRPSSWSDMTACLNGIGFHVYRLALQGHRGIGIADMHSVSAAVWEEEMREGMAEMQDRFPGMPRLLLGFSLGCLLAMTVQLKDRCRYFDRQVLLAPALAIRPYTRLVLPVVTLVSALPSRSPGNYVANREGTTAAAYRALFQLEREFRSFTDLQLLNIPTRVLMRSDDELISYTLTEELCKTRGLDQWQLIRLHDDCSMLSRWLTFRHLLVDRQAAGDAVWQQITSDISQFFARPSPPEQSVAAGEPVSAVASR